MHSDLGLWMMKLSRVGCGKMGNLDGSGLILARHYNQLQFNIPGLPAYLPPTSSSYAASHQKGRQNVLIKNRSRLNLDLTARPFFKWIAVFF